MITRLPLLASALALSLGGCAGTENRGLESVHQPVVGRADYALDLATAGDRLADGEEARLAGWFDAMRLGYGDRVSVEDPDGSGLGAAAQVGGVVAGYGLLVGDDGAPSPGPIAPGVLRVVVSRMYAGVPGCPDWSRDASVNPDAHTSSNYGCAGNTNLAAMIANPADLVRGQSGSTSVDPAVSTKAIDVYRKAQPSGAGGMKTEKAGAN